MNSKHLILVIYLQMPLVTVFWKILSFILLFSDVHVTGQHIMVALLLCSLEGPSCTYGHKWNQLLQMCTSKGIYSTYGS